jgi:hypothetical protein
MQKIRVQTETGEGCKEEMPIEIGSKTGLKIKKRAADLGSGETSRNRPPAGP